MSMDTESIVHDLNRRFAAPLPEFYKRRIIVWKDEDREFEDKLDEISLMNARLVILTGMNNFEVKKLIAVDDTQSNLLLYNPLTYTDPEDNWLLDVELYSEEFRADLISIWMNEMGIPSTPLLRKSVKQYRKFFGAKPRREKLAAQTSVPTVPTQLHLSVMAAICGLKNAQPDQIIHAVLNAGLDTETNPIYAELCHYGADNDFWKMIKQGTGYHEETPDIMRMATHIMLTALTRTMRQEFLTGLDSFISSPHQAYCYDFISDWMHSGNNQQLQDIARFIEEEVKLPQRFIKLQIDDLADSECFPCIDEIILHKLMTEVGHNIVNADMLIAIVEKRRTCVWYDETKHYYDGMMQLANMQNFYLAHTAGFHTIAPREIWESYTSEYFRMDTYYRLFHKSYAESLHCYNADLHDQFVLVKDYVEGLYKTWFLGELGNNWFDACEDDLRDYGYIMEVPKQSDFYRSRIADADSKIYVIISDALRYEVAAALAEQLRRETQSKVDLSSMQAVFPTITKFGMAALLPHRELTAVVKSTAKTERLAVLADGLSTESNNREKVLKLANSESVVLKYKELLPLKRQERSTLVKGNEVVYIYHDKIDHASHTDETTVFTACDEAIDELKNVVRMIVNEFGGTNILITADHGFLYTYSPLTEDEKVDRTTDSAQDVEYGRRYAIMQKDADPQYLMPVCFLDDKTDFKAFTPRENIRIKMMGAGLNFVHGGISLQEMCVPVIDYHYLRNDYKEYKRNRNKYDTKPVSISLLSSSRKISNMIFSLNFYQTEAVSDNREAAAYQLYFTDSDGKVISDVQKLIADRISDNGQERTFRCSFNLRSLKYSNTSIYYLIIADENGLETAREEFQIDIAFAVDEFDFFS